MNTSIIEHIRTDSSPRIVIGYGSGIIPQTGGSGDKTKLLDLIVVVDDAEEYINSLTRIGLITKTSAAFACSVPSEIAFFPHLSVGVSGSKLKLGVTDRRRFFERLQFWNGSFFIPGRLQKPIKLLFLDESSRKDFEVSQKTNLQSALVAALVLMPDSRFITDYELFKTIVSLSYMGDIRMGIAENPRKIDNIVSAQLSMMQTMYKPFFEYVGLSQADPGRWSCTKSRDELWNMIPEPFRQKGVHSANPRDSLVATLSNINRRESFHQALVGVGTAGIGNSAKYLLRKISKRIVS